MNDVNACSASAWWNDHARRCEWIKALRAEQRRRPAGAKTTVDFDAAFVGKSGALGYFVPWQPVRLFALDGPVAKPVNSGIGHGRLTVDSDELLAWFEKQEAP